MIVYYDDSSAGAGKTFRAIERIVRRSGRFLFITERVESLSELEGRIRLAAERMGTTPIVRQIHSDTENRGNSVALEIAGLPDLYKQTSHVIILATHAALLRSDFNDFVGWEIVIDEVPPFLDFEEKLTHLDAPFFSQHYELTELSPRWSAITLSQAGRKVTAADVRADQSHSHLSIFHARVMEASADNTNRFVLCDLPHWEAMADRKVKWCWASAFSLRQLEAFDRVELLGNRFRQNIGAVITQWFDDTSVEWRELPPLSQVRQFAHRKVHIGYFSDRPSARSYFESEAGQIALKKIGGFLAGVLPAGNSIWSANHPDGKRQPSPKKLLGLPTTEYLSPRQAGTNRYQSISHAAMIYAAKPSPNLLSLLKALSIDSGIWTRSIEHETVLQFVTRTSVRDPDNGSPVHLWVYDRDQAIYLKEYFDALPYVTTHVGKAHLKLDIAPKSKGGRRCVERTPEEQEAHVAAKQEKERMRKRSERAQKKLLKQEMGSEFSHR